MARIVVVDDDGAVREMLGDYLGTLGYQVTLLADGRALTPDGERADLYILDVSLPGIDGFALARMLRQGFDPGIVMLTGAGDLVDRVVGLEVGADDYLAKPVELPELAARIDAVLRRRRPAADTGLPFGSYRLDVRAFALCDGAGRPVPLSPMEIDLVAAFATHRGEVLTRERLLRLAPPRNGESLDRSIDHRVARLRRRLEIDPHHPELIKTVPGAGYVHP